MFKITLKFITRPVLPHITVQNKIRIRYPAKSILKKYLKIEFENLSQGDACQNPDPVTPGS
jgi:hypothetical protein